MVSLNSVKKWESLFLYSLEKKIEYGKVVMLKCKMCIKYEERITSIRGFSRNLIVGMSFVEKDSLEKHIKGDPHKYAANLFNKQSMGASSFGDKIIKSSPIGHGLTKMATRNKKVLENCFNSAYYLAKKERPYSDFPDLIELHKKNGVKYHGSYQNEQAAANFVDNCGEVLKESFVEDLLRANYYSILMDGSTDSSVIEQELIYVLF